MKYVDALKKALDEARPAMGLSLTQLLELDSTITEHLKRPVGDAERIMLCAERAAVRKALASLKGETTEAVK